jgi:hypothetical protein
MASRLLWQYDRWRITQKKHKKIGKMRAKTRHNFDNENSTSIEALTVGLICPYSFAKKPYWITETST